MLREHEANLPPRPYSYQVMERLDGGGAGHIYILDANGRKIASIWGKGTEKIALAELICDASEIKP